MRIRAMFDRLRAGLRLGLVWSHRFRVRLWLIPEVLSDEAGQDLIEYAIVVALISLAATVGMQGIATAIASAFANIASKFATYTT